MDTIEVLDKNECCGCSSCYQKCPQNAIEMKEDEEGFFYPVIDKDKCINCGLCYHVCPQLKKVKKIEDGYPKAYAMYNKEQQIQLKSSSGGIFTELANYTFQDNGVVFGAAYNEKFKVNHIAILKKSEINKLRKSKYVQSNIKNTYKLAEKYLYEGKKVLFTGTPCQIMGLKEYLGKEYDNLITCDLVCHGVPSQKAFDQYLNFLTKKNKNPIVNYDFRSKDIKDCEKIGKVTFKNRKVKFLKIGLDCYYSNFLEGNIFRESCYNCRYSNLNRVGDITIGDYLGALQIQSDAYSSRGTSLCIINSKKGQLVFNNIRNRFNVFDTTLEKISKYNSNLNHAIKRPTCRDIIYKNIDDEKVFYDDLKNNMKIINKIKSYIPVRLKFFLKKIRRN